ncbi:MAG: NADH-quinone oxidoreductase subunit N, partial [Candidatus Hinthialibacter sp.]
MVPFHFWAPDVYEGAPTPITAYLSVASKGAGFALLIRLAYSVLLTQHGGDGPWEEVGAINIHWTLHIAVLSAITMTLGNLGAIVQVNLKRLMAYSGVAHAGYLLMGVATLTDLGVESVILYLIMYLFTNLTAFLVIIMMVDAQDDERLSGVRGLWKRAPYSASFMTIALFSLTGIPPTAGFVGKYYIFYAVLDEGLYWLALVGILNTVISLYYYARIIKAMFFEDPSPTAPAFTIRPAYLGLLTLLTLPILYFGIWWDPLVRYSKLCASLLT